MKRPIKENVRKNELIEQVKIIYQNNMPTRVKLTHANSLDEQNRTPSENESICVDIDCEQKLIC